MKLLLLLLLPVFLSAKIWIIPYGHSNHYIPPEKNKYYVEKHNFSGIAYDYETKYFQTLHASTFINSNGVNSDLFSAFYYKKKAFLNMALCMG